MAVDVNGHIDKHYHDASSLSRTSDYNYLTNVNATDENYSTLQKENDPKGDSMMIIRSNETVKKVNINKITA